MSLLPCKESVLGRDFVGTTKWLVTGKSKKTLQNQKLAKIEWQVH
jgi:hypothetical protein